MKTISKAALRKKVGKKILKIRKSQKISQKQLGFEAGLSRVQISYVEGGHKNVTLDTLHSIAQALGVQVKDLF